MSQVKAYKPEVAVIVGIQASLLLNHIKYWIEEYNLDKVFRTNQQISQDFKGTLSESQIQRAKKKLVDNGLVIISHDKGHTRTTHYTLTEKAKGLLGMVVEVVKETVKKVVKKVADKISKKEVKSTMENSFKKQGETNHAIPMPPDVLEKLKGLKKPTSSDLPSGVNTEVNTEDADIDEDDYFAALDFGMSQCQQKEEPKLTFADLLNKTFNKIPNLEVFEKNRQELEYARKFKEDF